MPPARRPVSRSGRRRALGRPVVARIRPPICLVSPFRVVGLAPYASRACGGCVVRQVSAAEEPGVEPHRSRRASARRPFHGTRLRLPWLGAAWSCTVGCGACGKLHVVKLACSPALTARSGAKRRGAGGAGRRRLRASTASVDDVRPGGACMGHRMAHGDGRPRAARARDTQASRSASACCLDDSISLKVGLGEGVA